MIRYEYLFINSGLQPHGFAAPPEGIPMEEARGDRNPTTRKGLMQTFKLYFLSFSQVLLHLSFSDFCKLKL